MTANETDSVWPASSGKIPDDTKRSVSRLAALWPGCNSANWPGTRKSKNSRPSEICWKSMLPPARNLTFVIPIWSLSEMSVTSMLDSPGRSRWAPEVGTPSLSPGSAVLSAPSKPTSSSAGRQSPSLSIPSNRRSSIISSIPSSIPSSTAPSPSLSTPSA